MLRRNLHPCQCLGCNAVLALQVVVLPWHLGAVDVDIYHTTSHESVGGFVLVCRRPCLLSGCMSASMQVMPTVWLYGLHGQRVHG